MFLRFILLIIVLGFSDFGFRRSDHVDLVVVAEIGFYVKFGVCDEFVLVVFF